MPVDPSQCAFFIPPDVRKLKLALFNRVGDKIKSLGGKVIRGEFEAIGSLPDDVIPIVGCTPQFRDFIREWRRCGREWIYWDRGYARRFYSVGLPRGENGGYYRWHRNCFQLRTITDVSDDRWRSLKTDVRPWNKNGRHILVADTGPQYWDLHGNENENWAERTVAYLQTISDREIIVRDKKQSEADKRELFDDIKEAHCLVTHGSIAAVESVIMGCPVFVHVDSAAALVGETDLSKIESPIYPERHQWLNALAYSQFSEDEFFDGTLWSLIS